MKNINFKNIPFQIIVVLLFATQWVQAQPSFDDDVQDVPAAPIDAYVIPAIVMVVLFVLFSVYKRQKQTKI